jgi:fermentation-respiration switch protein FrsA (DUF1100 family)
VTYLTLTYVAWCIGLYFFQDGLLFPRELAPGPVARVPAYVQEVSVSTEDGRSVPGWFVPAPSASREQPAPAVLYFHGNAEIIDYSDRVESLWRSLNVSILFAEYRGYGRAKFAGEPSEAALVADGVRFFDELCKRPDVDRSRIILHGYSIGGGVATQVAVQRKPAALILESTFTSVADFAWSYGVPPFLAKHPFRTDEALGRVQAPIFIAHGRADHIVPVEHGRRLHAVVPTSTYVEVDCGHLDLPAPGRGDGYVEQIRSFLVRSSILR